MNESKPQVPRAVEMKNHLGLPRHHEIHVSRMVCTQSKWIIGAVEFCVAATHDFFADSIEENTERVLQDLGRSPNDGSDPMQKFYRNLFSFFDVRCGLLSPFCVRRICDTSGET
jgi:hypothetical protein